MSECLSVRIHDIKGDEANLLIRHGVRGTAGLSLFLLLPGAGWSVRFFEHSTKTETLNKQAHIAESLNAEEQRRPSNDNETDDDGKRGHFLFQRPQSGIDTCFWPDSCPRSAIGRKQAVSP